MLIPRIYLSTCSLVSLVSSFPRQLVLSSPNRLIVIQAFKLRNVSNFLKSSIIKIHQPVR